ncbi:hypothetical protein RHGRI_020375 [Rhododendron griersonianum]|uniref:Uncharacterized protein n=1 Tax=Rhododendron griersonianum TaxID=479676 RepID=A0AAV6JLD8_9ERIC|nr:hypothetical protein RHGRI_024042 [Rhododendron griersonianum]KAG5540120.1 hypothetical protein RHGRI_020375 [Rhododendron griersonianum]
METICVFYVISPMDSSNFPKEVDPNVEHEEAPGSDGMDGFLSDQANAIPGIKEKELRASLQSMVMDSKLNNMQHSVGTLEKLCKKSFKSFQDSDRSYDPPEDANVLCIQILDLLLM